MAQTVNASQEELQSASFPDTGIVKSAEGKFICVHTVNGEICNQTFKHKTNAVRHAKEKHLEYFVEATCSCGYSCKRKYDMQRHIQEKHMGERYLCGCGFRARNLNQAQKHSSKCSMASNGEEDRVIMDNSKDAGKNEKVNSKRAANDGEHYLPGSPNYVTDSKRSKLSSPARSRSVDKSPHQTEDNDILETTQCQNNDVHYDVENDRNNSPSESPALPTRSRKSRATNHLSEGDWSNQSIVKRRRARLTKKCDREVQTNISSHECPTCHNFVPVSRIKQGNVWILVLVDPNGDSDEHQDFNPNVILPGTSNEKLIEIEHLAHRNRKM